MKIEAHIHENKDFSQLIGVAPKIAVELLRHAIEDIADHIEEQAAIEAPVGETGKLSERPVERFSAQEVAARIGGKFAPGKSIVIPLGIPKNPKYAIFVHDGTGIYGPKKKRIYPRTAKYMAFEAYGTNWLLRSVKGQKPNPYLDIAIEEVALTYLPERIELLRREIETLL